MGLATPHGDQDGRPLDVRFIPIRPLLLDQMAKGLSATLVG